MAAQAARPAVRLDRQGAVMDGFTWFVLGIAGGAAAVLGLGYAAYKIYIWRHL